MRLGATVLAVVLSFAWACARPSAPPGGPPDARPPVVVRTEPDTFASFQGAFRGPVRFHFDERISERTGSGTLDEAVLVSPRTGAVRVGHGRQSLTVDMEGGFRPGLVYRVTLLPEIADMFGNRLRDPFEIVFSTGAALVPGVLGGLAWDRVTGRGVEGLTMEATGADSLVHVARTDADGIYVMRYLPPGRYQILAYQDRNRSGSWDPAELNGNRPVLIGGDTLLLDVAVLQPDTSSAILTRVIALDSVTVVLEMDDYVEPTSASSSINVSLSREGGDAPGPSRVFHEHEYVIWRETVRDSLARADSLGRLTSPISPPPAGVDTVVVRPPPPSGLPPELPGARASGPSPGSGLVPPTLERPGQERGSPDGSPLPSRRAVVRLDGPLAPEATYLLTVRGVVNLRSVPLGGGEAPLTWTPPSVAPADTVAPDTAAADTAVTPGTGGATP